MYLLRELASQVQRHQMLEQLQRLALHCARLELAQQRQQTGTHDTRTHDARAHRLYHQAQAQR